MFLDYFGMAMLSTGDLDPVYFIPQLLSDHLKRDWLLAYWLFYDAGTAMRIALDTNTDGWTDAVTAADARHARRGTERRHMRGINFKKALASIEAYGQSWLWDDLMACRSFGEVKRVTKKLSGFGPWITFKMADMLERCLQVPISFEYSDIELYSSPKEAARLWDPERSLEEVMTTLQGMLPTLEAPPWLDRAIGVQELETMLCKWGSHVSGHYSVGKDIREVTHSLAEFPTLQSRYTEALHGYQERVSSKWPELQRYQSLASV